MNRKGLILYILTSILLLTGSCIQEENSDNLYGSKLQEGTPCPSFEVVTMNQDTVAPAKSGKAMLLVFFNTQCKDCRDELPIIQEVYSDLHEEESPCEILCIARNEDSTSIAQYWDKENLSLPVSPQKDANIYHMFSYSGIPALYLIDKEGIIRNIMIHPPLVTYDQLYDRIQRIIQ